MLSDAERRVLAEIEQGLLAQDPTFVRRISSAKPQSSAVRWCGMGAVGWLVIAVLAGCVAILVKSGWMAVIAMSAVCLSMGLWAAGDGPHRPSDCPAQDHGDAT
jgi:hypothetical protein